jgi:hypothetical protein
MPCVQIPIIFMGEDFIAEVDYTVTSRGHPGTLPSLSYPGDPPEGPEYDVNTIEIFQDLPGFSFCFDKLGRVHASQNEERPRHLVTGAFFDYMAYNNQRITDWICDDIRDYDPEPDYDDRDYDWDE